MPRYRNQPPQLNGSLFLTDGGIETTLIFREGYDLPLFAAFDLLRTPDGTSALRRYFRRHAEIARSRRTGFILESATWRASPDWGAQLGRGTDQLRRANEAAIRMMVELREELETATSPMVISGCIGPRGDGYDPAVLMTAPEAEDYHAFQTRTFAGTEADLVTAITMTNTPEAVGITRAARKAGMPVVISFTVETDGRLPTGQSLRDAVREVDAETRRGPLYYMINCAHPTHFAGVLDGDAWVERIRGIRANASKCSHAELDSAPVLDDGDPRELADDYRALLARFPHVNVLGGCCGTDHRHIESIADSAVALRAAA